MKQMWYQQSHMPSDMEAHTKYWDLSTEEGEVQACSLA